VFSDDLTKGSYDFLGGSQVDASLMSYRFVPTILTLERGKMGKCLLVCACYRAFYFIYIGFNNGLIIFSA
jgi:hypothetical protein